jgi:hypothetical protein
MNRFRRAAWLTAAGLGMAAGCANPCREPLMDRLGFGHHHGVPVNCCPACQSAEAPCVGMPCAGGPCAGGPYPGTLAGPYGEGPVLTDPGAVAPGGPPVMTMPPGGAPVMPPGGVPYAPQPLVPPDRLLPVPQPAQPVPATPSSRPR